MKELDKNELFKAVDTTLQSLCMQIENNELIGSGLTQSIGEVVVNGFIYQIQLRLESDKSGFIKEDEAIESIGTNINK